MSEWLPLPDDLPDDMTFGELLDLAPPGTKGFYFDLADVPDEVREAEMLLTGQEP